MYHVNGSDHLRQTQETSKRKRERERTRKDDGLPLQKRRCSTIGQKIEDSGFIIPFSLFHTSLYFHVLFFFFVVFLLNSIFRSRPGERPHLSRSLQPEYFLFIYFFFGSFLSSITSVERFLIPGFYIDPFPLLPSTIIFFFFLFVRIVFYLFFSYSNHPPSF